MKRIVIERFCLGKCRGRVQASFGASEEWSKIGTPLRGGNWVLEGLRSPTELSRASGCGGLRGRGWSKMVASKDVSNCNAPSRLLA